LFESVEPTLDGVAVAVELSIEGRWPSPAEPLALRQAIWSDFSGMWLIFIFRSRFRVELWL